MSFRRKCRVAEVPQLNGNVAYRSKPLISYQNQNVMSNQDGKNNPAPNQNGH